MLWYKSLNNITWADIEALISENIEESQHLDFKREIPDAKHASRRDFLRDVCAFANSGGGDIIFGIAEGTEGIAAEVIPIKSERADQDIRRLESWVFSTIQPRPLVNIVSVNNGQGKAVVLLRVAAGLTGCHSVWLEGRRHFTGRRPRSTGDLSMDEIRDLFLGAAALTRRIRAFRMDRLQQILMSPPVPGFVQGEGIAFIHIVPVDALEAPQRIAVQDLKWNEWLFPGFSSANYRLNLDGLLTMMNDPCTSYVQLFRTGIAEVGHGGFVQQNDSGSERKVYAYSLDNLLIKSCSRFVPRLRALGISSPLAIFMSLTGVEGCCVSNGAHYDRAVSSQSYDRDLIAPPEIQVEGVPEDWGPELRPLCDMIWQASDWKRSPFFDENEHWIGDGPG